MEDRFINNQESIQIISEMLQKTKDESNKITRFSLVFWGLASLLVGILTYFVVRSTAVDEWNLLWLLLPALIIPFVFITRPMIRREVHSVTYVGDCVGKCLQTMSLLFILMTIGFFIQGLFFETTYFQLMAPLSVLIVAFTTAQVWAILKERVFLVISLIICLLSILFLNAVAVSLPEYDPTWNLYCGGLLFVLMFLPGILLKNPQKQAK